MKNILRIFLKELKALGKLPHNSILLTTDVVGLFPSTGTQ